MIELALVAIVVLLVPAMLVLGALAAAGLTVAALSTSRPTGRRLARPSPEPEPARPRPGVVPPGSAGRPHGPAR